MSEQRNSGVPFSSDDGEQQKLWEDLQQIPQAEPSPQLRKSFYQELDRIGRTKPIDRWRAWLGLSGTRGFATALGCALLGVFIGILFTTTDSADRTELSDLQQQVADLRRDLILDRLSNDSASKRLAAVIDAASVAERDPEIARALLTTAIDDRVYSVRAAAIDAIGPQFNSSTVGNELMSLLEKSESPIVQLALIDLILRHGSAQQLERLEALSEKGALHPELAQYVQSAIRRNPV